MFSRLLLPWIGSLAIQLVAVLPALAGLAATAAVSDSPGVFLSASFVVFAGTVAGLAWLAVRKKSADRRRIWLAASGALTMATLTAFSISVLRPIDDSARTAAPVDGLEWWELADGSRIGYTHTPPADRTEADPIVFLHGGPGVADLAGDTNYFGQLAADGYHVYVYDQLGTGHSSRLGDPAGYTLDRWATDLEEIRRHIGADRMILVGHSWGAGIAARYLDQNPDRVQSLILLSPGGVPGSDDSSGDRLADTLPETDRRHVVSLITQPRMLASYALLQINPQASRNFTPDREIDARMDRVYNASRAALHCPGQDLGPELHGLGFYAHQFPQSARSPEDPDVRTSISGRPVPTLIVKAECDYLSWSSAVEYVELLADTTFVYLEDAGHNVYQDRPDAVREAMRAFLRGEDTVPGEGAATPIPDGYLGPP